MKNRIQLLAMGLLAAAATGCIRYKDIDECYTRHKLRNLEKRFEQFNGTYELAMPDSVTINIPDHPDLSGTYEIRPDGNISFPLLQDVYVEGLTPMKLSSELATKLERFVRKVEVLVTVSGMRSKSIYYFSRPRDGGRPMPFTGDMTVLDVLANVGGWSRMEAFSSRIRLIRDNPDEQEVYRIRADRMVRGDLRTNVLVKENDMVYVPANYGAEIVYLVEFIVRPLNSLWRGAAAVGGIPYSAEAEYERSRWEAEDYGERETR